MSYNLVEKKLKANGVVILDGGNGGELESSGAKMDKDLWAGKCAIDDPDKMLQVHEKYINAGADIITSNTYAITPISMKDELLIGKQVISAPILKQTSLEVISTGYMLIDSGKPTTASYMSNTLPIPRNKNGIATSTAIAGEYLGMKLIYMDGGSGAEKPIEIDMIKQVSNQINIPLIVGGGICNAQKAIDNCNAGADLIVVGNAIEKNADLILEISKAVHSV